MRSLRSVALIVVLGIPSLAALSGCAPKPGPPPGAPPATIDDEKKDQNQPKTFGQMREEQKESE